LKFKLERSFNTL